MQASFSNERLLGWFFVSNSSIFSVNLLLLSARSSSSCSYISSTKVLNTASLLHTVYLSWFSVAYGLNLFFLRASLGFLILYACWSLWIFFSIDWSSSWLYLRFLFIWWTNSTVSAPFYYWWSTLFCWDWHAKNW